MQYARDGHDDDHNDERSEYVQLSFPCEGIYGI